MDKYRILYADGALQDLRDIYDYISVELQEPNVAYAQIKRIRSGIRALNSFPARYKPVIWESLAKHGMRQLPINNFIVFMSSVKRIKP